MTDEAATPLAIPAPYPRSIEDLEGDWLPRALHVAHPSDCRVKGERIGEGRGHMGSSYRLTLSAGPRATGIPESVVVKVPALTDEARDTAERAGLYEREFRFYTEVASRTPVAAPRCYAAGYAGDQGFALVLEDVGGFREIDQIQGIDLENAKLVLSQLAEFHAAWWNAPVLSEMSWATRHSDGHRVDNLLGIIRTGWPRLCRDLGERMPPGSAELGMSVADALPTAFADLAEEPQTLLHGDVRLDNLLFDETGARPSAVILDWQSVSRGPAALDASYFLAQNLDERALAHHGQGLLAHYAEELAAGGVDYDSGALKRATVLALPLTFAVASSLYVVADTTDARTRDLAAAMARRAVVSVDVMGHPNAA